MTRIPTLSELGKCYELYLPNHLKLVSIPQLIRCLSYCRFDPRLAELMVGFLSSHWKSYSPFELQLALSENHLGAHLGVLLEFSKHQVPATELPLFQSWMTLVLDQARKHEGELFFIGVWQMGSPQMMETAQFSTLEYETWGFLGRANLCARSAKLHFAKSTRLRILASLFLSKKTLSVKEYWDAIGHCITLRQAERDVANFAKVTQRGYTRNKRYSLAFPLSKP